MSMFTPIRRNESGAAAIEFAIVAPVFLLVIFTLIAYGIYLSAAHAVQQIAADAARTAVAGLSESERRLLAEDFISRSSKTYSFINPSEMKVVVADDPGNTNQFTVTITYDSGELPIWKLFSFALPDEVIRRDATIRLGGI